MRFDRGNVGMAKRGRRLRCAVGGAALVLLGAPSALATDAVTVARGMAQKGDGLKGQLNVDGGGTTGNTELWQIKAGMSLADEAPPHSLMLAISAAYAEHEGTAIAEQSSLHLNYRYRLIEHVALEAYVNSGHDKFAGFDVTFAAGPDVVFLFDINGFQIDVGLGYMLQYEEYGVVTGPVADEHDIASRAQLYVFVKYDLAENLELIEHAFYMPRLDGPGPKDYMIISATSLSIQFNPLLSFQNSFNLAYDRPPPFGTKGLNTELMVGLAVKF
jgi:uncharacterized protein DUF481